MADGACWGMVLFSQNASLDPGPLRTPEPWAPPREGARVPQLSTSWWSQVLNAPQKGPWLPSHTWHLGAGLAAGVCMWGGWCAGKKSAGHSALPGLSRLLSWDFPSPLAQAREERSERALSPARHLARLRRSSPRLARSPPSPGRAPRPAFGAGPPVRRPPLCPPADARAESESPAPEVAAVCRGPRSRRPDLGRTPRRGEQTKGSVSAGGVCPESSGCLRRDRPVPLHTCPPRSGSLLRCRSPGPRGGAGRGGSFRLLVPDLDPGGESLGDKAWEGRGREGSLNPSYFPPTAHLTPRPTPTLGAGRSAEDPENPSVLSCTCDSKQGGKRSPGLCLLHLSPPPPPPSIT